MKTSKYTEARIILILRQVQGGMPVPELCREHGMSNSLYHKWRAKYGGALYVAIPQTQK
jgi:putative transposase